MTLAACTGAPEAGETAPAVTVEGFGALAGLTGTRWRVDAGTPAPDRREMSEWSYDLADHVIVEKTVSGDGQHAALAYYRMIGPYQKVERIRVSSDGCRSEAPVNVMSDGSWSAPASPDTRKGASEARTTGRIADARTLVFETEQKLPDGWRATRRKELVRTDDPMPAAAPEPPEVQWAAFGPLARLAGTRWYGDPGEEDMAKGQPADISEWQWELGGAILVNRHVLENGSYGGITLIRPDCRTGALSYDYITSAGFVTSGTFELKEDGSWVSEEDVHGIVHILKVRSTGRLRDDGTMTSESKFLGDDGEWGAGHVFTYSRTDMPMPVLVPAGVPQ
ncbi:MAG: hypothetical protein KDA53_08075 [Hyphomonas sp.]|nr:hypothetical protein [Hyphomonas sp.]